MARNLTGCRIRASLWFFLKGSKESENRWVFCIPSGVDYFVTGSLFCIILKFFNSKITNLGELFCKRLVILYNLRVSKLQNNRPLTVLQNLWRKWVKSFLSALSGRLSKTAVFSIPIDLFWIFELNLPTFFLNFQKMRNWAKFFSFPTKMPHKFYAILVILKALKWPLSF